MDPLEPEGLLPSVFGALDRPGQAVRNVLRGRFDAAGRHLLDFLGDVADAPVPGDWIGHTARRDDYISGAELVGAEDANPFVRTVADVLVGTATNPLSYAGFGPAAGAANAIKIGIPGVKAAEIAIPTAKAMDPLSVAGRTADAALSAGAKALDPLLAKPGVAGAQAGRASQAYEDIKRGIRSTLGWQNLSPEQRAILDQARAAGSASAKVSLDATRKAMQGLDAEERILLGDAFDALDWGSSTPAPGAAQPRVIQGALLDRVAQLAARRGKDPAKLQAVAQRLDEIAANQWAEGLQEGVFRPGVGRPEYLQRQFTFPDKALDLDPNAGVPGLASAVKGRNIETPQDLADFIAQNPDVGYQRDALERMAARAAQQGRLVSQARVGRAVGNPQGNLLDDRADVKATIETIAANGDTDFADRLAAVYQGLPQRGPLLATLANANRLFKPAAVYGVVLPRVGSIVRNQLGMVWQAATTPGAKVTDLRRSWDALAQSFDDAWQSVTGSRVGSGNALTKDLQAIEGAIGTAKSGAEVSQILRQQGRADLAEAVEQGILDGFVSSEEIINKIARSPKTQKAWDIYDAPGVIFQGVEQRGRLGAFLEMRLRMSPEQAGQTVRDTFLDYNITSAGNRTLRDLVPFAQFIAQTVPQQAKALSNTPALGVGLSPLFTDTSGDNEAVYPWMEGKTRVPLGEAANGNPLYLTGLGLPIESLDVIPNLSGDLREVSRDIGQGIVASGQPLAKSAFSLASGEDPYFGTPIGSYDKIPLVGSAGAAGRAYNLAASTGLLAPIDVPLRLAGQALNQDRSVGVNALDVLTGAKVSEVDPDLAIQRRITQELEARPDVKQYRTFYGQDEDDELSALMAELQAAKRRAKERRHAATGL